MPRRRGASVSERVRAIKAMARRFILALAMLAPLGGCISSDAEFPPPQPPSTALRFKATAPGQFPVDVFFSAWGEGYVIHTAGQPPLYLVPDKKGGYIVQGPGQGTRFVVPRSDGSGFNILSANGPAVFLLKQDGGAWILQPPGDLPTLIQPQ